MAWRIYRLIDHLFVKITIPWVWNSLPKRQQMLESFGDTEADTVWQLYYGIEHLEDSQTQVEVFYQIMEEVSHAEQFYQLLKNQGYARNTHKSIERLPLYSAPEDLWKLLAYCYVGEAEAAQRFSSLSQSLPRGAEKEVLDKIILDETGHISKALKLLKQCGVSEEEATQEIASVFWRRRREQFVRITKKIGYVVLEFVLLLLYFSIGIFATWSCKRRLKRRTQIEPQTDFKVAL